MAAKRPGSTWTKNKMDEPTRLWWRRSKKKKNNQNKMAKKVNYGRGSIIFFVGG